VSDINRAAERHVRIPDDWFGSNPNGIYYISPSNENGNRIPPSHDVQNFIPIGIKVGIHHSDPAKQQTSTITMATVRGWLHGESIANIDNHELLIGPMEPIRFAAIASVDTDGRKIVIYGA